MEGQRPPPMGASWAGALTAVCDPKYRFDRPGGRRWPLQRNDTYTSPLQAPPSPKRGAKIRGEWENKYWPQITGHSSRDGHDEEQSSLTSVLDRLLRAAKGLWACGFLPKRLGTE
ncbi:hypothetical protein NDU88_006055 [Pleurodeles waltl]|uniref:Uncharacterized protein n=1 Tax=Pleurodeles waltl TaxID=8319 RepID=A0AAV7TEF7_PLEWA|nr:hypothetical protein NDU88_006055 [Pleurodeles waltl]